MTTNTRHEDDDQDENRPTSWIGWKTRATQQFQSGNYEAALYSYTQALRLDLSPTSTSTTTLSTADRQILLSNVVACRLKLGGRAQAEVAVEIAKQCIALNPQWAKGHVRLASAYIALDDPSKSNDACRELQKALQLDPNNPTAREMLVQELRRDHRDRHQVSGSGDLPRPSAPPQDLDDRNYASATSSSSSPSSSPLRTSTSSTRPQDQPTHTASNNNNRNSNNNNRYNDFHDVDVDIDDRPSWQERFQFYIQRAKYWYGSQNDDVRTLLKVCLGLVCLYVAFGGRFGLEYLWGDGRSVPSSASSSSSSSSSSSAGRAGNYVKGNAYESFYQDRHRRNTQERQREYYDPYEGRQRSYGGGGGYYGGDTAGVPNMLILAGVAYMAHRNGVNPFQALFFANMAMNGGRRGGMRGRGFGGGGFGGGGFGGGGFGGGGFGRARYGRHRPGGMWGW